MNKSSSLLLHLHLHLLHFLIMNKSSYLKIYIYKKKGEIFRKGLRTRGIGLVLLRLLSKKKKKNHQSKFSIPSKNSRFPKFFKKTKKIQKSKKKSSLNSSSGTKSYDPFPYFSVVQHRSQLSTLNILRSMEYVPN